MGLENARVLPSSPLVMVFLGVHKEQKHVFSGVLWIKATRKLKQILIYQVPVFHLKMTDGYFNQKHICTHFPLALLQVSSKVPDLFTFMLRNFFE